eukprot:GFUD01007336.1.p1 GENE.GFUD01007336.1~~GFUD01007336.1.p1  ORF type:complete len:347 (-),score=67.21 GFUD01007336.1:191-1231(-)
MAGGDGKNDVAETKTDGKDGKDKKETQQEFKFSTKAVEKSGWEGFMQFLWNTETNEFLGRTGMSWLKIGLFYVVYYAFLAGFFMLMLLVFFQTLDDNKPTWEVKNDGIIGKNPGVGFRPMPPSKNIESTLMWFRHGEHNGNWQDWAQRLEDHMTDYKNESYAGEHSHAVECGHLGQGSAGTEGICKINQDELFQGRCKNESGYGFGEGKPCILVKLNKIYGWEPEPYVEVKDLPENIPKSIKDAFEKNIKDGNLDLNKRVWLECDGENPADKENIGEINYYPDRGVSASFYPYKNQKGYLSPVVFAQLENPRHGVMIAIECKAWAKNIEHDSMERRGLAHFELMID